MHFTFKGIRSDDMGIIVAKRPNISTPSRRVNVIHPSGRDNLEIVDYGATPYIMNLDIILTNIDDIDGIKEWLQGEGWYTSSDMPKKKIWVEIQSGLNLEYLVENTYTSPMSIFVKRPWWVDEEDKYTQAQGSGTSTLQNFETIQNSLQTLSQGLLDNPNFDNGLTRWVGTPNGTEYPRDIKDGLGNAILVPHKAILTQFTNHSLSEQDGEVDIFVKYKEGNDKQAPFGLAVGYEEAITGNEVSYDFINGNKTTLNGDWKLITGTFISKYKGPRRNYIYNGDFRHGLQNWTSYEDSDVRLHTVDGESYIEVKTTEGYGGVVVGSIGVTSGEVKYLNMLVESDRETGLEVLFSPKDGSNPTGPFKSQTGIGRVNITIPVLMPEGSESGVDILIRPLNRHEDTFRIYLCKLTEERYSGYQNTWEEMKNTSGNMIFTYSDQTMTSGRDILDYVYIPYKSAKYSSLGTAQIIDNQLHVEAVGTAKEEFSPLITLQRNENSPKEYFVVEGEVFGGRLKVQVGNTEQIFTKGPVRFVQEVFNTGTKETKPAVLSVSPAKDGETAFKLSKLFLSNSIHSSYEGGMMLVNLGNRRSNPIFRFTKGTSDKLDVTIGSVRFKYTFPTSEDHVIIDSYEKQATYKGLERNIYLNIGYTFPTLDVGGTPVRDNLGNGVIIETMRGNAWT